MSTHASAKELRNMPTDDLRKEAALKRMEVAKMTLSLQLGSEKDSAKMKREKKELARILTVLNEKKASPSDSALKKTAKASTVSAPKAPKKSSSKAK